jgi:hypothetical protein
LSKAAQGFDKLSPNGCRGLASAVAAHGEAEGSRVLHREEVVQLVPEEDEVAAFLGLLEQVLHQHCFLAEFVLLLLAEVPCRHELDGQADHAEPEQRLGGEPERKAALDRVRVRPWAHAQERSSST